MANMRALECDLIMKGGVTSGLVYPGAIARIARDYRICSIGGNPDAREQLARDTLKRGGHAAVQHGRTRRMRSTA